MNRAEIFASNHSRLTDRLKQVDGIVIKQEDYPLALKPKDWQWEKYLSVASALKKPMPKGFGDENVAKALSTKLNSNTSAINPSHMFGNKYPRSAFFFLTNGPNPSVIIEFTKVIQTDYSQISYTHNLLRDRIQINERCKSGWKIRSGHYGQVRIPGIDFHIWVALIDSLTSEKTLGPENSPEFPIAMTLLSYDIIPITSDGQVVPLYK